MRRIGRPFHVGVVIGRGHVLHADEGIGAVLEPEDYRAIPLTIDALAAEVERLRVALAAAKAVQDWHALDGEPDPWFDLQEAKVDTRQFTPLTTA